MEPEIIVTIKKDTQKNQNYNMTKYQVNRLLEAMEKKRDYFMFKENHFINMSRILAVKLAPGSEGDLYTFAERKRPAYHKLHRRETP